MHFIGHVREWSVKITPYNDLIAMRQAFKTMLQVIPHMLPLREDLTCAMLHGPCLVVNDHEIMWVVKVHSYLKQAAMNMGGDRNLILSNKC